MEIEQLRVLVYQHICQLTNEGETPLRAAILAFDVAECVFGAEAKTLDRDVCIARLRDRLEAGAATVASTKAIEAAAIVAPATKEKPIPVPDTQSSSGRR